jgi:alanine dehydrogenase
MSEVAGRMSPLVAAWYLGRPRGGSGVLAPGAAGVPPAHLVVLGAGTVGSNAARVGHALGMRVTVLNRGIERLRRIDEWFEGEVATVVASRAAIEEAVVSADAVVGAVLVPGKRAPVLLDRALLGRMRPGSVLVDVAIDQGGCAETSRPTTHADPVYVEEGVIHYAVANMPGAYPRTSTIALTNATLPYIKRIGSPSANGAI